MKGYNTGMKIIIRVFSSPLQTIAAEVLEEAAMMQPCKNGA